MSAGVLAWFGVWSSVMVSPLNCAASATWRVFAASGLVSVVFAAIAKIKNVAHIIRANIGRGGGKAKPAVVFVGVPSLAGGGVENNFVSGSDWCAGARVLSGEFRDHSFLHGFSLKYIGSRGSAAIRRLCPIVRAA